MLPEDRAARQSLYESGLNDAQIATELGLAVKTIWKWRIRCGLPAHTVRGRNSIVRSDILAPVPEVKRRCHNLLARGVGASLIAREMRVSIKSLERWRTEMLRERPELRRPKAGARKVPRHPNGRVYSKMRPDRRARAFVLYADGRDDFEIAKDLGIRRQQVWEWRNALFLPAIGERWHNHAAKPKPKPVAPAISPMSNPLYAQIARAIGRGIAPDLIDDAVSDMWLAVAEGCISTDQIAGQAGRFRNKILTSFANRFGTRSLDEEIGLDGDGFRMLDLIRDERSSSWLEQMGATVW